MPSVNDDIAFVVMAAGLGSRYGGVKQLETFGNGHLTIAEWNMTHAIEAGFKKFYFIINDKTAEIFHRRLKKFLPTGCSFDLIYQKKEEQLVKFCNRKKPWGTAHAVMCCQGVISCNFCVTNADDLYGRDAIFRVAEFLKSLERKSKTFANVAYLLPETLSGNGSVSRGLIRTDGNFYLKEIVETHGLNSKTLDEGAVDRDSVVSMNLWGFTPEIFKPLGKWWDEFKKNIADAAIDEFGLPDVINAMVGRGECEVKVLKTISKWLGITHAEDKFSVEKFLNG
jgi:NDP-sugar pyrophosphorylase family protein